MSGVFWVTMPREAAYLKRRTIVISVCVLLGQMKSNNTQQHGISVSLSCKSISGDWRLLMFDEHVEQVDGVEDVSSSNIHALICTCFSMKFRYKDEVLTAKRSLLAVSLDDSSLY